MFTHLICSEIYFLLPNVNEDCTLYDYALYAGNHKNDKNALMISFHWNKVFEQTPARLNPPVFLYSTWMIWWKQWGNFETQFNSDYSFNRADDYLISTNGIFETPCILWFKKSLKQSISHITSYAFNNCEISFFCVFAKVSFSLIWFLQPVKRQTKAII